MFNSSLIGVCHDGKRLNMRAYLLLFLLCMGFFLPGIASLSPTDKDESLFAEASKQMIETHDYVDINFLGTPRYKKPVGIYWLQVASVKLLNPHHLDQIWAYRVPSVIGATIAVLLTAALGTLLYGGAAGLVAAAMLASCLDLDIEAHLAKTDAALLAAVVASQYALARAWLRPKSGWRNALLFWTAIGAGILLKGPIILLTLGSTLLWLHFTEKNLSWFKRLKPLVGVPWLLVLILPWFIAISLASHGQFAAKAGGHDLLGKLWQGQDSHAMPPGLHALIFPAMFFPFSICALLAIPDAWRARNHKYVRFCVGWIVPTWIVFEISLTKLPHYVLPAYPAIALLTAKFLLDGFPSLSEAVSGWRKWRVIGAVALWLLIGMGLAIALSAAPVIINGHIDAIAVVGSILLLLLQGIGLMLLMRGRIAKTNRVHIGTVVLLTAGAMIVSGIAISHMLPGLQRVWISEEIVQQAKAYAPCQKLSIVSAGYEEPSLAFLAGSNTKLVPNGTYAAAEMQHDLCRVGVINKRTLRDFLLVSSDLPVQPHLVGTPIEGVHIGPGSGMELFLYVMPQTPTADLAYP